MNRLQHCRSGPPQGHYEVVPFALNLTPSNIIPVAETITVATDEKAAGQAQGER
ncbi:hypothetical protein [Streptomyces sp. Je 1-332]|uniref:hypothetical protein n=1 Tax=Streptomyces sp. Je 1-332 TaxID=3231270 RepID=UPI0034586DAB